MIECISMILVGISAFIAGFLGIAWLAHVCDSKLVFGKTDEDYVAAANMPSLWEFLHDVELFCDKEVNEQQKSS